MARAIPIYRRQGAVYRGPGIVYRRPYEELPSGAASLTQPLRRAVTLRFYDKDDVQVAVVSSNAQRQLLLNLSWELLDTGCGQFEVELASSLALGHDYRIDVHLWNAKSPIYSGLVTRLPRPGSTERTWTYGGAGFLQLVNRVVVAQTYGTQTVQGIISDLISKLQARFPRIGYDQTKVEPAVYTTNGPLEFLRAPLKDAFDQAAALAGGYTWGVDADRNIFFRSPNQEVDMHRWVGHHLETFIPQEESDDIITLVYIRSGKVRNDISTDDPFYKTNWLTDPLKDDAAIELYGTREGIFTAPSMLSQVDAQLAAKNWLQQKKRPRQYASVKGLKYNGERLTCSGSARIVGRNGEQLVLPKKKLKFQLKPAGVEVSLELGDLDYTNFSWVAKLAAAQAAENLARQQAQKQL